MKQWYTLYTKPQTEYQVAAFLQHRGLEVFLPEIEVDGKQGTKPFFPRYLFLKIDFDLTDLAEIQWTPGLVCILAFDDHPQPIRDEVIILIRNKLADLPAEGDRISHDFEPGDTVRITTGPFADMLAIFEGPTTPSQRVQILLKVLGGSHMQIKADYLERAEAKVKASIPSKRPRRTRGRGRTIKRQKNLQVA